MESRKWKMETDKESGNRHGKWKIFHAKCSFFQEVYSTSTKDKKTFCMLFHMPSYPGPLNMNSSVSHEVYIYILAKKKQITK